MGDYEEGVDSSRMTIDDDAALLPPQIQLQINNSSKKAGGSVVVVSCVLTMVQRRRTPPAVAALLFLCFLAGEVAAFSLTSRPATLARGRQQQHRHQFRRPHLKQLFAEDGNSAEDGGSAVTEKVEVGSGEYYKGFVESPIIPSPEDVDGDAFRQEGLEQAIKLGAQATAVLGVLFLGFMASNGLL